MYINCISCGHKFDIGRAYDDYEGPVRCATCRSMLMIRTQDGSVRSVRPATLASAVEPSAGGPMPGSTEGGGGQRLSAA